MSRVSSQRGFTLIELMVVVAIIGILASTAAYNFIKQEKRATRTEVTLGLDKIKEAQAVHYIEFGEYAATFDDLVFSTAHGSGIGCGSAPPASRNCYQGGVYQYMITSPPILNPTEAELHSYRVRAEGNIDGDAVLDTWIMRTGILIN